MKMIVLSLICPFLIRIIFDKKMENDNKIFKFFQKHTWILYWSIILIISFYNMTVSNPITVTRTDVMIYMVILVSIFVFAGYGVGCGILRLDKWWQDNKNDDEC